MDDIITARAFALVFALAPPQRQERSKAAVSRVPSSTGTAPYPIAPDDVSDAFSPPFIAGLGDGRRRAARSLETRLLAIDVEFFTVD